MSLTGKMCVLTRGQNWGQNFPQTLRGPFLSTSKIALWISLRTTTCDRKERNPRDTSAVTTLVPRVDHRRSLERGGDKTKVVHFTVVRDSRET